MNNITFDENLLIVKNKPISLDHKIKELHEINNLILVLLDPGAKTDKSKKYKNLIAYDFNGNELWKAELPPSKMTDDAYWKISKIEPLVAKTFSSHTCEIDISTGNIINKSFYK